MTSHQAGITKKSKMQCSISFRLLEYSDHVEFHFSGENPLFHDHSLDESDANKRNNALRGLAQADIAKGYAPAAVIGSISGFGKPKPQLA
jgi:hypothetical protein